MDQLLTHAKGLSEYLRQLKLTISTGESLTGGLIASSISSVSGSSKYFQGGICCYSLNQKVEHLGVDRDHAASCNCVSERVAAEMASGAARLFGTDIALSTTGYAEKWEKPGGIWIPPQAFYQIWMNGKSHSGGHIQAAMDTPRNEMRERVAYAVLSSLNLALMNAVADEDIRKKQAAK